MPQNASTAELHSRRAEWRAHWTVVLAALVGFSFPTIGQNSLGLFMDPLIRDFGWSRTEITAGISLSAIIAIFVGPIVGILVDRYGSRRLALPGLVMTGVSLAAFGLANGSWAQWMMLWIVFGLVSMLLKATVWASALVGTFNSGRSLALGIMLTGSSLANTFSPLLAQFFIEGFGWRTAYLLLSVTWGIPALLLSFVFLVDGRRAARDDTTAEPPEDLTGLSIPEACRDPALISIAVSTFLILTVSSAFSAHAFPILTDVGLSRTSAALVASAFGASAIVGKLMSDWLADIFDARRVGGATNTVTGLGMAILVFSGTSLPQIMIAMLIIGYTIGTKLHLCTYLTAIYGGTRNFGKIYSIIATMIAVGSGLGPLLGGIARDMAGNYDALLIACIPASLISAWLILRLGPYPVWHRTPE